MTDWAIPQQAKLKYTQLFNLHDRSRSGFLSGLQCRDILLQSGLPRNILAEIWNLSDIDGDGQLTREEFILAMHLTNHVRSGQTLPAELPADLVPPSYRRTRSISATSVHSAGSSASGGTIGASTNDDQVSQKSSDVGGPIGSLLNSHSFEDKRRENFEKGRAELERRRLKMIEQQTSILNDQLIASKKQVAEAKAKIDKMRSERDTKAGLLTSLEAQLKTVRERKAYLDHEELGLIAIAKDLNLVNSAHAIELDQQATKAKQEDIKQMKEKLVELQKEKENKINELSEATKRLEESRRELKSVLEEVSKSFEIYKEKVSNAKVIRQQFIEENKTKTVDLDSIWDSAPSFSPNKSQQPDTVIQPTSLSSNEDPWATTTDNSTKLSDEPFASNASTAMANSSNSKSTRDYSALTDLNLKSNDQPASEGFGFDERTLPEPTTKRRKYRALYTFDARNVDELTLNPGDIIIGSEAICEPGWISGELNGRSGLFPEAYVEELPDDQSGDLINATTLTDRSNLNESEAYLPASSGLSSAKTKYTVIYQFNARNPDELTIKPGDIITGVDGPHEPGWLMGELSGQRGLFPEAYVEKMAEVVQAEQTTTGVSLLQDLL